MTDNTDTLDTLYEKYQLESESESVDWFKLKQALNLYIEEKERLARLEILRGFRRRDFVLEAMYETAILDRIEELRITDEDIKKGWPEV